MFAVNEIAPNAQQPSQSQTQNQVIASVVAQQKVIAARASADSGNAAAKNFSSEAEQGKVAQLRQSKPNKPSDLQPDGESLQPSETEQGLRENSETVRSIIEAQEASNQNKTITAAFQARHGLTDLLSVIRDPEDRMLPQSPKET